MSYGDKDLVWQHQAITWILNQLMLTSFISGELHEKCQDIYLWYVFENYYNVIEYSRVSQGPMSW